MKQMMILRHTRTRTHYAAVLGRLVSIALSMLVLIAAAVAPPLAAADPAESVSVDEHPGMILTDETNCFETNDRRPVLLSQAESYVPDRYTVTPSLAPQPPAWFGAPDALVASVGFIDYVCESLAVNGHHTQPTIVSLGTVLVKRDDIPTTYILWVGTDNPLLFARLQQLGVEAYFIPRSSYTETVNEGGLREITVDYVGSGPTGLNYTRTITVLTAPSGATRTSTGLFYHMGRKGEVSFTYKNVVEPTGTANVCFELGPESLPTEYGITSFCFPRPRQFFRGSWAGTIELVP